MKNVVLSIFLGICFWQSVSANNISTTTPATTNLTSTTSTTPLPSTRSKSKSPSTTVLITTSSNGTSTTVPPTSRPTPASTCSHRNTTCGECVKDISCFWCGADDTCRQYHSSIKLIPRHCSGNKWYWKQCFAAGNTFMFKLYYFFISLKLWCQEKGSTVEVVGPICDCTVNDVINARGVY